MAAEKRLRFEQVDLVRVESKADFVSAIGDPTDAARRISELHFIGHSGMYGPMFRTTDMPEQFSPHERRHLSIPFSDDGTAWFHACRTARWFAPFFARTFKVPTYGYHWYTTFSGSPERFKWERGTQGPLYLVGCPGRKSHGLLGTAMKYLGLTAVEEMKRHEPKELTDEDTYERVAGLYDAVFEDIRVRADEWRWLNQHLPSGGALRLLDVGCGNGALLDALRPLITHAVGVDRSPAMIEVARRRRAHEKLRFEIVDGPVIPLADQSVDVVVSLLSFRYLDWDPIMNEMRRVLVPGGRILIIDMVTVPLELPSWPLFFRSVFSAVFQRWRRPGFRKALANLVADEGWQTMLKYNPIRAQHEFVWYLESRFPGRKVETLNVGRNARVLGFDSGPLEPGQVAPQSYP